MVIFSNCKINLGLHIVAKRPDGFHDIETVFYPIPFYDVVEIISAPTFTFTTTGLTIDASTENNLSVKAYHLLKKDYPSIPEIKLHLHKNIPLGGGLGGGSANAAYTLSLLNRKYLLNLSAIQLKKYTAQLGSDCSFFIENKPCFATGRGELLQEIACDLSQYKIVLLLPGHAVKTADAFAKIVPQKPKKPIPEIINSPIQTWKNNLTNDFEASVFLLYPALANLKDQLYECGAIYASMSGSGSSIYGIFEKKRFEENKIAEQFKNLLYKIL